MKGYLFISEKNQAAKDFKQDIQAILAQYNGINYVRVKKAECSNVNVGFYTFTNEPKDIQYTFGEHQFGMSGDFLQEESVVFNEFIESDNKNDYIADLGGIYTFASLLQGTFAAWNNVTRVEPIYWAETNERIVIGTKAILVHLIANNIRKPIYNVSSMTSFLNNGFYADENTPFEGLNILNLNHKIQVENNIVKIAPIDNFEQELYSINPTNEIYDELTGAFLNSFSYLKRLDVDLTTGLTGGKDSRMVAAALHHLGIDVHARTTGYASTPDVVVAQEIAQILGIKHEFNSPGKGKDVIATDLYLRTVNTIKNTEGLLYSYENVGGVPKGFNEDKLMLGGQGGENLRGGYARAHQIYERELAEKFMLNAFIKYKDFFNKDAVDEQSQFLKDFIYSKSAHLQPNDILNYFYLAYRGGRWAASSRPFYTSGSYAYSPLFENQLVKKTQFIQTKYGSNDSILYNVLQRIEPKLLDIPFADDRWNFEKNHPYHKKEIKEWINRQPVQATTKLSAFNWRKNVLQTSKEQFADVIFGNENSPLFDIVDKEKLKRLFMSDAKNLSRYDVFLWSLYTSSILLSNEWFNETVYKKSRISIKTPKQTTQKVIGVTGEIKHISSGNLKSNHKKLIVDYKDEVTNHIHWDDYDGSHMYLQLFDEVFSNPPSMKFNEISKVKGTHAEFYFEIEKVIPNNFEIELYFIQYDGEKRIKSTKQAFYISVEKEMYSYKVPLETQTKFFKIAFKIAKMTQQGNFILNQMRLETLI